MKENWVIAALIILISFLLAFDPFAGRRNFFGLGNDSELAGTDKVVLENQSLKAELAKMETLYKEPPSFFSGADRVAAFVYSRYPFNFKNEILVNVGENQGIKPEQPAIIPLSSSSSPLVIGKVEKVFADTALVQTVFDGRFQMAVRIGNSGVDGLLRGGVSPVIDLLPKDANVGEGDIVYSADPGLPYGLAVGVLKNLRDSGDRVFRRADVQTAYNINELKVVDILKTK